MPYNTKSLKRDSQGVPAPQYFNSMLDDYEPVIGLDGGIAVTSTKRRFREDFAGSSLGSNWTVVAAGSGHSVSVASSELRISTGTTANTETVLRLNQPITVPSKAGFIVCLSQRIANQEFYLELVTADGQHAAGILLDGTSATTGKTYTKNPSGTGGPSTWTTLSSWNYSIYEIEIFTDEVVFNNRGVDSISGRSYQVVRTRFLPDPNQTYYVQIRARNLSTAPASSTTLYVDAVVVQDIQEFLAEIVGGNGSYAAHQAIPVLLAGGTGTANVYNRLIFYTDTTTALAANATFTGTTRDTGSTGSYSKFRVMTFADQPGTLYIEGSRDASTWRVLKQISVSANVTVTDEVIIPVRYVRVRYLNGSTAQGTFELNSALVAV